MVLYNGPLGTFANLSNTFKPANMAWDGARGMNYSLPRYNGQTTHGTINQIQAWAGRDSFDPTFTNSVRVQVRIKATNAAVDNSGTVIYDTGTMLMNGPNEKNTGTAEIHRPGQQTILFPVSSEEKISVWINSNGNGNTNDEFGIMVTWNLFVPN
jgi:hypothetical protein